MMHGFQTCRRWMTHRKILNRMIGPALQIAAPSLFDEDNQRIKNGVSRNNARESQFMLGSSFFTASINSGDVS